MVLDIYYNGHFGDIYGKGFDDLDTDLKDIVKTAIVEAVNNDGEPMPKGIVSCETELHTDCDCCGLYSTADIVIDLNKVILN